MAVEKSESSQNLLEKMEDDWDLPKPGGPEQKHAAELDAAELDAAADRLLESLDPPPVSVPNIEALDTGWGDDDDDEEEEEEEEEEPELPDERLDPVAYAAAKKARDERIEARRQRRRVKAEAKKARRKARVDAQKQKQKGKTKKAKAPTRSEHPPKVSKASTRPRAKAKDPDDDDAGGDEAEQTDEAEAPRSRKPSPNRLPSKSMLSGTNQWMLAIAVVVFVAAAVFAAVVAR